MMSVLTLVIGKSVFLRNQTSHGPETSLQTRVAKKKALNLFHLIMVARQSSRTPFSNIQTAKLRFLKISTDFRQNS